MYIPLGEKETAKALIAQGEAKAMKKARKEADRKTANMIKNFLANGVSPEIVAKSTGIPIEQIRGTLN